MRAPTPTRATHCGRKPRPLPVAHGPVARFERLTRTGEGDSPYRLPPSRLTSRLGATSADLAPGAVQVQVSRLMCSARTAGRPRAIRHRPPSATTGRETGWRPVVSECSDARPRIRRAVRVGQSAAAACKVWPAEARAGSDGNRSPSSTARPAQVTARAGSTISTRMTFRLTSARPSHGPPGVLVPPSGHRPMPRGHGSRGNDASPLDRPWRTLGPQTSRASQPDVTRVGGRRRPRLGRRQAGWTR
jgi:hypothetical protein